MDFFLNLHLKAIFLNTKFGIAVLGPHPHAKFHRLALKMWAYSPENRQKIVIFGIKLP